MGNEQSTNFHPRREADCFDDDGRLNHASYYLFQQMKRKKAKSDLDEQFEEAMQMAREEEQETFEVQHQEFNKPKRKRRSCRSHVLMYRNSLGNAVELTWEHSSWYDLYVHPDVVCKNVKSKKFLTKFRRRFCMPY